MLRFYARGDVDDEEDSDVDVEEDVDMGADVGVGTPRVVAPSIFLASLALR